MLLSLAINTEQSIDSFLFYLIQYTITNLNIFLIILAVTYSIYTPAQYKTGKREDIRYISELKGLFFSNPLLSLSLCISLFSMAGLPPLIGFFSKQFVLYSALQNGYYFISLIAIIVSVISASYYLKIIKVLHTDHDYFEDKLLKGAVEENKAPNQSNVLLNEDKDVKEFKEFKEFKEGAKEGLGVSLTAEIPIETLTLKEPLLPMRHEHRTVGVESRVRGSLSQSSDPILLDLDLALDLEESKTTLTNTHSFVISSLTLIILLFFIKPYIILNSTQLLSLCAPYEGFCCRGFGLIPLVYLTVNKFNDTSCWYSRLFKLRIFIVWIAEYKYDK
jgi:NADH:ubiquinone oxidoreductase subunit 5 (subunit L)/multisubunit Na+/H+ antiporter MnhA subunit